MKKFFQNFVHDIKGVFASFKNSDRKGRLHAVRNIFLVVLGSFVLAFGTAMFLIPDQIVGGGLSSIGVIITYLVPGFSNYIDILVLVASWTLFLIGWFVLGTKFALHTLISTIVYPLALMLFMQVGIFVELAAMLEGTDNAAVLINGIFGGILVGAGGALTFIGGGSTGGVDILYFIVKKFLGIKQSITSFVIDALVIIVGIVFILIPVNVGNKPQLICALIGIISVLMSAIMIELVYIKNNSSYMMDVISDKWQEISQYVQNEVGRGVTILPIKGGYKEEERIMIRMVFDKSEYDLIKHEVNRIDPIAFITMTQTEAVFGEGFDTIKKPIFQRKKEKKPQNTANLEENERK